MSKKPQALGFYARMEMRDKWSRHLKRATSYLRNAERVLFAGSGPHAPDGMPEPIVTLRYEYEQLLETALEVALEIARKMPADYFAEQDDYFAGRSFTFNQSDDAEERVKKLAALFEKRRGGSKLFVRIKKLETMHGRTPQEAELFTAKAAELRGRLEEELRS